MKLRVESCRRLFGMRCRASFDLQHRCHTVSGEVLHFPHQVGAFPLDWPHLSYHMWPHTQRYLYNSWHKKRIMNRGLGCGVRVPWSPGRMLRLASRHPMDSPWPRVQASSISSNVHDNARRSHSCICRHVHVRAVALEAKCGCRRYARCTRARRVAMLEHLRT